MKAFLVLLVFLFSQNLLAISSQYSCKGKAVSDEQYRAVVELPNDGLKTQVRADYKEKLKCDFDQCQKKYQYLSATVFKEKNGQYYYRLMVLQHGPSGRPSRLSLCIDMQSPKYAPVGSCKNYSKKMELDQKKVHELIRTKKMETISKSFQNLFKCNYNDCQEDYRIVKAKVFQSKSDDYYYMMTIIDQKTVPVKVLNYCVDATLRLEKENQEEVGADS